MDPDTTLSGALAEARATLDGRAEADSAQVLAQALCDLDEWLAKGGYLPARWRPAQPARPIGASLAEPDTSVPERRRDRLVGP